MADHHPDHSSQAYSVQRQSQLHTQFRQQQHQQQLPHLQVPQSQRIYRHDNQGPYSAGVIEDRRAFPNFRGSSSGNSSSSVRTAPRSTSSTRGAATSSSLSSKSNLSISDILDRFSASPEEFVITVLNAKAKEDERKTEEERYKTEVLKLQSRQLDISLAMEKRRSSPSARHTYANSTAAESFFPRHTSPPENFHHGYSAYPTPAQPTTQTDTNATRAQYSAGAHQTAQEQSQHSHQHTTYHQTSSPSSSPNKPSPPRIDTTIRQNVSRQQQLQQAIAFQQQQIKKQRQYQQQAGSSCHRAPSPKNHGQSATQSPVSSKPSASISGRHHILHPFRSSSTQSSPVTNVDMQSQIPQPLSPDDYASPTSATSSGSGLKRKSINHDEVMEAIRAKVLRNAAAGYSQQQKEQRDKPRRKPHPLNNSSSNDVSYGGDDSPERANKKTTTLAAVSPTDGAPVTPSRTLSTRESDKPATSPTEKLNLSKKVGDRSSHSHMASNQEDTDEPFLSPHPATRSPPASMSPPSSASRSNSSSPRMEPIKQVYERQYQQQEGRCLRGDYRSKAMEREQNQVEAIPSRFSIDHSHAERASEVGGMSTF
ncbi:hypothetical protein FBU30_000074 [Linnemannia zychae]|nr:hypothetical protein FBU30_000074 [Linnemannia zychae]